MFMYVYVVIEIQTSADGTVGNFVWSFGDTSKTDEENRNGAFSKWHSVLSSAAVSDLPVHSCVIIRNDGQQIASMSYKHGGQNESN